MRKIVEHENHYILPIEGLRLANHLFYQPSGQNMIVLDLEGDSYKAGFTLESFDLYDLNGNEIATLERYMVNDPLANEICLNAFVYKSGVLEIQFTNHKFISRPLPEYEAWSFWDSNGVKIFCLANGNFMTVGLNEFINF